MNDPKPNHIPVTADAPVKEQNNLVNQEALVRQAEANAYADAKAVFADLIKTLNTANKND